MAKRAASTPEMRVAYLTSQYPATSHTFISREIAALRAIGIPIETFSIRPPAQAELQDESSRAEAARTFTVLRQPLTTFLAAQLAVLFRQPGDYFRTFGRSLSHRPPGLRALVMSLAYFAEALVLARELQKRRIGHLHNHFANAGAIVGLLAARLADIPWSFTMHGISETDYPAGLLLGKKIETARFVACVSYFGRAQAMRTVAPDQWSKLHVLRCGLPLTQLPKHRGSSEKKRMICVGRLSPEKGQAGLLEAFASVARESDAELILVGDGPEAEDLRARAERMSLKGRVTFAGRLGELETLERIAASDILILTSFMEGLPIVLMEAMALGTAVIASRVAGIPELVEDGKSGLLFTPSKWDELADCMRRLLDDEPLRQKLARNGQKVVAADFDIKRSAEMMRTLLSGSQS